MKRVEVVPDVANLAQREPVRLIVDDETVAIASQIGSRILLRIKHATLKLLAAQRLYHDLHGKVTKLGIKVRRAYIYLRK